MSDDILDSIELEKDNNDVILLSYNDIVKKISDGYFELLNKISSKIENNKELYNLFIEEMETLKGKYSKNSMIMLTLLTDNFLYCLEHIVDHNGDYFLYQMEKVKGKNGKVRKNKISKIVGSILFKTVLQEMDNKTINSVFTNIHELFTMITDTKENKISFKKEYIEYIHENFSENKNYNKIIMVLENTDEILNQEEEEIEEPVEETVKSDKKDKKSKKKDKGMFENMMNPDFIKNLENTKIAKLAKNISEKINIEDFPLLNDPSKLFESFTNPGSNGDGGNNNLQDLMKTVIQEVQTSFKDNKLDENDLISEAQGIMNNMGGFNPMDLFNGGGEDGEKKGFDFGMIEKMFSNLTNKK